MLDADAVALGAERGFARHQAVELAWEVRATGPLTQPADALARRALLRLARWFD
jgi:hypothetical protein